LINKLHISEAKGIDDTQGIVEAYVNTMGVKDHDGDVIDSEAFDSSIRSRLPIPVLSGHDQSQLVGKVLFAQSEHIAGDEHRLFARMQMNMDTQAGRDAYSNIAGAYVREWSVGFNIPGNDAIAFDRDGKESVRHILDLDWVEVSSVVRGASPSTMTVGAKSETETVTMPETVPDVETEPQEPTEPHESEPEEPETDTGADQPDEPGQAAPDTDVQSASSTVQARLRLLRSRLQLQGIKTN
jgi:HK97 family phage prohead protease